MTVRHLCHSTFCLQEIISEMKVPMQLPKAYVFSSASVPFAMLMQPTSIEPRQASPPPSNCPCLPSPGSVATCSWAARPRRIAKKNCSPWRPCSGLWHDATRLYLLYLASSATAVGRCCVMLSRGQILLAGSRGKESHSAHCHQVTPSYAEAQCIDLRNENLPFGLPFQIAAGLLR